MAQIRTSSYPSDDIPQAEPGTHHDIIRAPILGDQLPKSLIMHILHVHIIKHVVHVLQADRPSIEQRDERVEVFLFLRGEGEEVGGLVDRGGPCGEGWAFRPAF